MIIYHHRRPRPTRQSGTTTTTPVVAPAHGGVVGDIKADQYAQTYPDVARGCVEGRRVGDMMPRRYVVEATKTHVKTPPS